MPSRKRDLNDSKQRNILVVCLDTVRADVFAKHANHLHRMADVSFTQCRAASSWTVPSHASMFTGQLPSVHSVHTHNRRFNTIEQEDTFLADLDGYTTFGVSSNTWAAPMYGFDTWFDSFDVVDPRHRYPEATSLNEVSRETEGSDKYLGYLRAALADDHSFLSFKNTAYGYLNDLMEDGPIPKLVDDGAAGVLRTVKQHVNKVDSPYFGFCNLMEAHTPLQRCVQYDADLADVPFSWTSKNFDFWDLVGESDGHDEYWKNRKKVYAASIDYLDRILAKFVHYILDSADRQTTIIITADHGENHGSEADEYLSNHKSSLSESLIHVPLLLINPPEGYSTEENDFVSHFDLGRLVIGLAHGDTPDVFRDRLPAELVGMSAGPEPPSDYEYWDRMIRCVYDGTTKTVWDSLGNCSEYEIQPDCPSWQSKSESREGIPNIDSEFFEIPIEEAKVMAKNDESEEILLNAASKQRLQELGYL
ncbi:sulfatase-like hydrolase/transferase [Haladaptatus sp. CMAA 1911]|uniref:sulfatase-like hydrolase/transferase n=1 Tax=unclassified Haladaptatus TaxID=2622732 RepID=UPI0037544A3B